MRTNIKLYLAAGLVGLTAGCTDLDVDVKSKYTEFPSSEIAAEAKTNDAYFAIRAALGRRYDEGVSFNSDEYTAISFGGDYLNSRDCANFSLHSIDPSASKNQLNVYNDIMAGITRCNTVIVELGGPEAPASAPVRAARAFYTFLLMDNWGDAPIIDRVVDEDEQIDRAPRADVARWIESELLAVRDNCTTEVSAATYGRPTRWMVDALLAKLYINWVVYTQDVTSSSWSSTAANEKLNDCVAACDEIIKSGLFNLNDDYKAKFLYNNGPHIKDFIYVMPFDAKTQQGLTYSRFRTWRQGQKNNGFYSVELSGSVGGNYALTPEYVALFTLPGDRRNDCIAGDATQETFDVYQYDVVTGEKTTVRNLYNNETPVPFTRSITLVTQDGDLDTGKNLNGWCQGYKSIKFFPYVPEVNENSRNMSNDVPIFRYADVLLMKCEAITRGATPTNGDTPQSLFNQIRAYVNAPAISAAPSLQDILDERGREFLDEHWRRNDLIRFGDFERDWGFKHLNPNSKALTNRLWPLSVDVLNTNTSWKQNPGY